MVATRGEPSSKPRCRSAFGETPLFEAPPCRSRPGEILAIMGPSGSGKSTLLALPGWHFQFPIRARLSLTVSASTDWTNEAHPAATEHFGFVFQFGQLVPELSAEENVALPLLLAGVGRVAALNEARSWFERLSLKGIEGRRSGELSGGEAQRVALARGLVAHPEVLFADEPTGSLDSLTGEFVMELMVDAARNEGTTVLLVTHEARVAAYADREIIVRDGLVNSLLPDPVAS